MYNTFVWYDHKILIIKDIEYVFWVLDKGIYCNLPILDDSYSRHQTIFYEKT